MANQKRLSWKTIVFHSSVFALYIQKSFEFLLNRIHLLNHNRLRETSMRTIVSITQVLTSTIRFRMNLIILELCNCLARELTLEPLNLVSKSALRRRPEARRTVGLERTLRPAPRSGVALTFS